MNLFEDALAYAMEKHAGQRRKHSATPYLLHPMEVAAIVGTLTSDEEVLAAALLHDVVEDAGTTFQELRSRFGERVMALVASETESAHPELSREASWHARKAESLLILAGTDDLDVKRLWLGDKLSNMRSFHREYLKKGISFWDGFHQRDVGEQLWYYQSIAEYLSDLSDTDAYREYVDLMERIFELKK